MTEEKSQLHSLKLQQQQCSPAVRKYVEHVHKTAQAELARRTQMEEWGRSKSMYIARAICQTLTNTACVGISVCKFILPKIKCVCNYDEMRAAMAMVNRPGLDVFQRQHAVNIVFDLCYLTIKFDRAKKRSFVACHRARSMTTTTDHTKRLSSGDITPDTGLLVFSTVYHRHNQLSYVSVDAHDNIYFDPVLSFLI